MILVILGTHFQPFTRAVQLASGLGGDDEEIVVQGGHTPAIPDRRMRWHAWIARAELDELIRDSRLVIVHGGSGSIFRTLRLGVNPVVVPRLARLDEHVDDHQRELSMELEKSGYVVVSQPLENTEKLALRVEKMGATQLPGRRDLRPTVWSAARTLADAAR